MNTQLAKRQRKTLPRPDGLDSNKTYYWFELKDNLPPVLGEKVDHVCEALPFNMPMDTPICVVTKGENGAKEVFIVKCKFQDFAFRYAYQFQFTLGKKQEFWVPIDNVLEVYKVIAVMEE